MLRNLLYLGALGVLLFAVSCVPNKRVLVLQENDLPKQEQELDSIVRSYDYTEFDYKLRPFDILYVQVNTTTREEFNLFQPSGMMNMAAGGNMAVNPFSKMISERGTIAFPAVGEVMVAGLTIDQARDKVDSLAATFIENPNADVRLMSFNFSVLGEVNTEGFYSTLNARLSIIEAIAMAGGMTDLADRSQVKVIRQSDSASEVFYIDLTDEASLGNERYFLHPNDVLVVPPLPVRPFRLYLAQNVQLGLAVLTTALLITNIVVNAN